MVNLKTHEGRMAELEKILSRAPDEKLVIQTIAMAASLEIENERIKRDTANYGTVKCNHREVKGYPNFSSALTMVTGKPATSTVYYCCSCGVSLTLVENVL
jgi:hypothetical protein